jgi:hypothetical protein
MNPDDNQRRDDDLDFMLPPEEKAKKQTDPAAELIRKKVELPVRLSTL